MVDVPNENTKKNEPRPPRLAIITPCRNEADHLAAAIESVAQQSFTPAIWVIVDDGSTDGSAEILTDAQTRHPFIRIVSRQNRGFRLVGPGVIDAFYEGLGTINLDDYDFVCKLDADLDLQPDYFSTALRYFENEPRLGNLSGKVFYRDGDRLVSERLGDENACGAAKLYRVECFKDIGGFVREVCWDGIDGHMCRMKGWIALSIDDPDLRIVEHRRMGESQVNLWEGRRRWGRGKYYMGSSALYVIAAGIYRMLQRPYLISGTAIILGYLYSAVKGQPRHADAAFIHYLRRYEWQSLFFGRRRTLKKYNDIIRAESGHLPHAGAPIEHRG